MPSSPLLRRGDLHADRAAARRRRHHGGVHRPRATTSSPTCSAPKFPASFMALEQNPDWQLIQFMIAPTRRVQPASTTRTRRSTSTSSRSRTVTRPRQASAAKELNAYIVEQAWFAPFYRVQGSFATDAAHERRDAAAPTPPVDLRHPAQGVSRLPARPGCTGAGRAPTGPARSLLRLVNGDHHASIRAATPASGVVLVFVISVIAFTLLYLAAATSPAASSARTPPQETGRPEGRGARARTSPCSPSTGTG